MQIRLCAQTCTRNCYALNWGGPIFICGFCVAAKLAFSDRPLTPRGPKKGQKGPFGATHVKNGTDRLEANGISVVLPLGVFRIRG